MAIEYYACTIGQTTTTCCARPTRSLRRDHLGSSALATDASRNITSKQNYYAFGDMRSQDVGAMGTDFAFTGQRQDAYIKLIQMGARWYDPAVGRFVQPDSIIPDPFNPQSLNRYSYAYNNPLRYRDPTGHDPADSIRDFLNNTLLQWAYVNSPTQQAREACTAEMAKAQDPVAANAGRSFGNALAMWQAASEMVTGVGLIGGGGAAGLATCAETLGGGCVVGAGIAVGGVALTAHGAAVGVNAIGEEIKLLGSPSQNITSARGSPSEGQSSQSSRGGWKYRDDKWLKEQGIDPHHLKEPFVGKEGVSRFDVYQDENGVLQLVRKDDPSITVEAGTMDDILEWLQYEGDE